MYVAFSTIVGNHVQNNTNLELGGVHNMATPHAIIRLPVQYCTKPLINIALVLDIAD